MSAPMQVWLAIAVIVGQGALVGAVLWAVRSFGAYTRAVQANTEIVLQTHCQNMLIEEEVFNLVHDLTHYRAERRQQPPQSEEVVA